MNYKTHLATTFAVSLPYMASNDALTVGSLSLLAVGAVFPDIDEPNSYIGRRLSGVSHSFKSIFGHRGLTHSIVGLLLMGAVAYALAEAFGFSENLAFWFCLGYFAHLVEDSFSKKGISWLQPLSKKRFQSGFNLIYYSTGSIVEQLIFILSILAILYHFSPLEFGTLLPVSLEGWLSRLFD